jgi:hypothetical protein
MSDITTLKGKIRQLWLRTHKEVQFVWDTQLFRNVYSEAEVVAFEQEHNVRLPEEYRQFLLEIGLVAELPITPLFPLKWQISMRRLESMNEADEDRLWEEEGIDVDDAFLLGELNQPFSVELGANAREAVYSTLEEENQFLVDLSAGYIALAFHGCQVWTLLITAGSQRGHVWVMDGFYYEPLLQCQDDYFRQEGCKADVGIPLTFFQWYNHLLDKALSSTE